MCQVADAVPCTLILWIECTLAMIPGRKFRLIPLKDMVVMPECVRAHANNVGIEGTVGSSHDHVLGL